jgi:hypothetical protein
MRDWISALAACRWHGGRRRPGCGADGARLFHRRAAQNDAPRQLDQQDREYYGAVFAAIDRKDWAGAKRCSRSGRRAAAPAARAELYLAAGSPRVELPQIEAWLQRGRELPQAEQLARLAGDPRGGGDARPALRAAVLCDRRHPKRTRPRSVDDGTMPGAVREAILARIDADDPDGARVLLDGSTPR